MWPGWSRKLKFLNLGDFWSCPKSLEIAQLTWKSKSAFWGLLLSQMGSNLTCLDLKGQSTSLRSVEVQKVGFVSKKWLWSQSLKFGLEQTWIESNELEMDWGWTWRVDLSFFEGPTYVWWTFDPNSELWRSKFDMKIWLGIWLKKWKRVRFWPFWGQRLTFWVPGGSIYPSLRVRPCLKVFEAKKRVQNLTLKIWLEKVWKNGTLNFSFKGLKD